MKIQFGKFFSILVRCLHYFPAPSVTVLAYVNKEFAEMPINNVWSHLKSI